uniref:Uncharacterized protein n=1 Tax=Rhodosorus marinus TaxID=101924 RepID=A0A7S3E8G5_9RHOD|mmetsp:Transcript_16984/g.69218  ORF Transcript_16984/g.69218 Transcript_16984/m.69218 type:complete len:266 (+) Transcript_16984:84-881(+)
MKVLGSVSAAILALIIVSVVSAEHHANCTVVADVHFKSITHGRGKRAGDLIYSLEFFRSLLGSPNNGRKGPKSKGHRWINWDDEEVPFELPYDYFNSYSRRGLVLESRKNKFRVSTPPVVPDGIVDKRFSSINKRESKNFKTFTRKRLFTPVKDNVFAVKFYLPGESQRAFVQGFGAVFVGVDVPGQTRMVAYDRGGCVLAAEYVEPSPNGLSFLGFYFDSPIIWSVEIKLGNKAIDKSKCGLSCGEDVVVMDDILFSEPVLLRY